MKETKKVKPIQERTEDEKLTQAPITVILGGKSYKVKLLPIMHSRPWRKEVVVALSSLPKYAAVNMDDLKLFGDAINQMLVAIPDTVIDLFFGYAKDLNREEIEAIATDDEMAIAFGQVIDLGFPLARSLVGTMTRLSQ